MLLALLGFTSVASAAPLYWTQVTLTANPSPSLVNESTTLKADICLVPIGTSSCSGSASGDVTFYDDGVEIGTASGTSWVTLTTTFATPGVHHLSAMYVSPQPEILGGSGTLDHLVTNSSLSVDAGAHMRVFGEPITVTFTIVPAAGETLVPSGSVAVIVRTWNYSGVEYPVRDLGSVPVDEAGKATLVVTDLPHYVEGANQYFFATYSGDAHYTSASANSDSIYIDQTYVQSVSGSAEGPFSAPIVLPIDVQLYAPTTYKPGGSVQVWEGPYYRGSASIAAGHGEVLISPPSYGWHSYTLKYGGDFNTRSATGYATLNVTGAPTTTVLSAGPSSPQPYGTAVTLTATVTNNAPGANPVYQGDVQFFDGATLIGSATVWAGIAQITTNSLSVGVHGALQAKYLGLTTCTSNCPYYPDYYYYKSTSATISYEILKADTTTQLLSSTNPSLYGQPIALVATVQRLDGSPASGSVTFKAGAITLGTVALASGVATLGTATIPVGDTQITATFGGSATESGSAATLTQTVGGGTTTLALATNPSPSTVGVGISITATVAPVAPSTANATGTVSFYDGATLLGTAALASGQATLYTSSLALGAHSLSATYAGDAGYSGSSGSVAHTVNVGPASCSMSSVLGYFGDGTKIQLVVSPTAQTTGSVTFFDNATLTPLATVPLVGGKAAYDASGLSPYGRTILATYSGDTNFLGCSSLATATISKAPVVVSLTSAANPTQPPDAVVLIGTVAPKTPNSTGKLPTGTLRFYESPSKTLVGAGTIDPATGMASLSLTLAPGVYTYYASYGADAYYGSGGTLILPTNSPLYEVIVGGQTATVALNSSSNPSALGSAVTFSVTVTGGKYTPGGSVVLKDGASSIGASTLDGSGKASFVVSSLAAGTHPMTVFYGGSTIYASATSNSVSQVVNRAPTTLKLTAAPSPAIEGSLLLASVTLAATGIAPAGSVELFADGNSLGSLVVDGAGQAVFSPSLAAGSYSLQAKFAGDSSRLPSDSNVVPLIVKPAPDLWTDDALDLGPDLDVEPGADLAPQLDLLVPPGDLTTPPKPTDLTAPPVSADLSAPPVSADLTAPPVVADLTAPPVVADLAAPPATADLAGATSLPDLTAPVALADLTIPATSLDLTAPPLVVEDLLPPPTLDVDLTPPASPDLTPVLVWNDDLTPPTEPADLLTPPTTSPDLSGGNTVHRGCSASPGLPTGNLLLVCLAIATRLRRRRAP